MIYPQCFNGTMAPFITASGFVVPCCQTGVITPKIKSVDNDFIHNPFYNEEFSLYEKDYLEIVSGSAWNNMIENLKLTKVRNCWTYCGTNKSPITSPVMLYDNNYEYNNKRVLTQNIDIIQLETSNRCALDCLYCARRKQTKNSLNNTDIPISILKKVLKAKHWNRVIDCGTYGDPIFYKHYHEMLSLIGECMIDHYKISIAATGKSKKWWDTTQSLWKELNDQGIHIVIYWGIDGLESTSNLHRKNQDWFEIFNNMVIAAKNGLNCSWQFIPMSFNEHQIDEAKKIAEDIGVTFFLKASDRFSNNDPFKPKNNLLYYDIDTKYNVRIVKNKPLLEFNEKKKNV